jgi:hypothetical protein
VATLLQRSLGTHSPARDLAPQPKARVPSCGIRSLVVGICGTKRWWIERRREREEILTSQNVSDLTQARRAIAEPHPKDDLARQLSALAQSLQAEDHVDNTGSHGIGPGRSNPGGIPPDHDYSRAHLSTGDPVHREPRNRWLHAGIEASGCAHGQPWITSIRYAYWPVNGPGVAHG